ncbi:MAG: ABC-2 family transporter protein [Myxococcota bacterium]
MSLATTARALPTLVRVGLVSALAYRAELFVWILTSTMPLVMLALFAAVAESGPIGNFGSADFTAYFLATFVIRQFTASWAAWEINEEVRSGTLALRLLRPVSPIVSYAVENLSAMPLRLVVAIPVAVVMLLAVGTDRLPHDVLGWAMFFAAWLGGWLLNFTVHVIIGTLSLWLEQSMKIMDVWFAGYLVFSGYLIPIALFPPGLRDATNWLPFHAQIGVPIELLLGTHPRAEALQWLGVQWGWVLGLGLLAAFLWKRGLHRFAAVGG